MNAFIEIIMFVILLFLVAFTAASEISIIASSRLKLRKLSSEGYKAAKIILGILEMPERFFSTVLVMGTILGSLIAVVITAILIHMLGENNRAGIALSTAIASFLIIVPEVVAKTFAANYAERVALILARPIQIVITIFSPLVKIFEFITRVIIKIVGGKIRGAPSLVTEEEIRAFIKLSGEEGGAHREKYKLLSRVFDFSDALVKDVMTPKKEMVMIDVSMNLDDILTKVLESGYSRIPVYKDNPENIIGIINMKDLLNLSFNKGLVVLQDILYPATFVTSSKKVTDLLKEFQKGHTHLAIVIGEHKRVEGIITLEDLLEEIVGEIEDEYDVRASNYKSKTI